MSNLFTLDLKKQHLFIGLLISTILLLFIGRAAAQPHDNPPPIGPSAAEIAAVADNGTVMGLDLPILNTPTNSAFPDPVLDPDEISWASIRNQSSSEFSTHFNIMSNAGYLVIDLEVDPSGQVSAVWQRNFDDRGWASWRNLSHAEFSDKWNEYNEAGYFLRDQESYVLDDTRYYAGVWIEKKASFNWASYRNVTSAEFSERFASYSDAGYMPIDVEAYQMGDEIRYSAIWVENVHDVDWVMWRDITPAQYGNYFQAYKSTFRVWDVESYERDNDQNFAAIWIENTNGREWAAVRDMDSQGFTNRWYAYRDRGYRLLEYDSYQTDDGTRYLGVWRQVNDRPDWELKSDVDQLMTDHMNEFDPTGMSVAIAKDGEIVYLRGFGHGDVADNKWANSRTVYRTASVAKALAGVLALRVEENGDINLDLDTSTYVPDMPAHHTHTVAQTLSNRSGIGHYDHHTTPPTQQYDTAKDAFEEFWDEPFSFSVGSYAYSTFGYTAAGAALEAARGEPIADIINQEFVSELGLTSMRAEDLSNSHYHRAAIYDVNNVEWPHSNISWKVLGGGMESSAYDLLRLGMKLLDGSALSQQSIDKLWTPVSGGTGGYGYGWDVNIEQQEGLAQYNIKVVGKAGAQSGANSYIRAYPEHGIVIVVLSNKRYGGHSSWQMSREIGKMMLLAEPLGTTPTPVATPLPAVTPIPFTLPESTIYLPLVTQQ